MVYHGSKLKHIEYPISAKRQVQKVYIGMFFTPPKSQKQQQSKYKNKQTNTPAPTPPPKTTTTTTTTTTTKPNYNNNKTHTKNPTKAQFQSSHFNVI